MSESPAPKLVRLTRKRSWKQPSSTPPRHSFHWLLKLPCSPSNPDERVCYGSLGNGLLQRPSTTLTSPCRAKGSCSWAGCSWDFPAFRNGLLCVGYVELGVHQGHREDLTGGGLIRSLGDRTAVRKVREQDLDHVKGNERISGSSDLVEEIRAFSGEHHERRQDVVSRG
jgi:hypothetical protein